MITETEARLFCNNLITAFYVEADEKQVKKLLHRDISITYFLLNDIPDPEQLTSKKIRKLASEQTGAGFLDNIIRSIAGNYIDGFHRNGNETIINATNPKRPIFQVKRRDSNDEYWNFDIESLKLVKSKSGTIRAKKWASYHGSTNGKIYWDEQGNLEIVGVNF